MNPPEDLIAWRKAQRARLIAERLALPESVRTARQVSIAGYLNALHVALGEVVVGFYWPYRGEPDLTGLIQSWIDQGTVAALPAPLQTQGTVQFRRWSTDAPMTTGAYGIPVPDGTEVLVPDVLLAPLVGHDDRGYRLGYGGGYFDRLMANIAPAPVAIGIGLEQARLNTIFPQPYDMPMDYIVTESGLCVVGPAGLRRLDEPQGAAHLQALLKTRRLPRRQSPAHSTLSSPVCYASEFPGYFGESESRNEK